MASIRKAPSASPIQQKNAASPSPLKPLPTQGGAKKSNEINTKPLLSRARQYVLFFFGVLSFWLYNLSIIDRFPQSVRFFVQVVSPSSSQEPIPVINDFSFHCGSLWRLEP